MAEGITYEQMRDLLNTQTQALTGIVGGAARQASGGGGKGGVLPSGLLTGFTDAVGSVAVGARKLADGTLTAGNALGVFTDTIGKISGVGPGLSKAFNEIGDYAIKANTSLNEVGKSGVSFGGNLGEYSSQVRGARLTNQEFEDQVRKNAAVIGGTGSTMDRSAKNYLSFTKDLQESGVVSELKAAGMSAKEVADIGMITMANRRGLDMADAATKREAVEAAKELAAQINETARITGKSREKQIEELKAREDNVVVQAELMQLDDAARGQYTATQSKLSGLGASVQDVADEIFTGGVRTKEGAAKMAALGPAGAQLEAAILQSKNATTKEDKDKAAAALERAKEEISAYQRSKSFLDQVKYDTSAVGDAARKQMKENAESAARMAAIRESKGEKTEKEITAQQKTEVTDATLGIKTELNPDGTPKLGKDGKPIETKDPNAQLSQTINKVDQTFKDMSAGLAKSTEPLNTKFGELALTSTKLNDALKPRTQEQAARIVPDALKAGLKEYKPSKSVDNKELIEREKEGKVDPNKRRRPGDPDINLNDGGVNRLTGSPGVESFLSGGPFNGMFEQFGKGTPATLHGEEMVATKKQMESIVDKIAGSISQIGIGKSQVEQDQAKKAERDANVPISLGSMNFDSIISKLKPPELPSIQPATSNKTKPGENAMASSVENMDKTKYGGGNVGDMFTKMSSSMEGIVKPNTAGNVNDMFDKMKDSIPGMGQIKPPPMFNDLLKNIPTSISAAKPADTTPKGGYGSGVNNPSVAPPPPANDEKKQTTTPKMSNEATLDDVKKELVLLNTSIRELIRHSSETADASSRQVKATRSLSGNRFA